MNTTLLLMFAIPMVLAGIVFYLKRDFFAREIGGPVLSLVALPGLMIPGFLVVVAAFAISHGSAVNDTEIWNGAVTGKDRVHDSYTRSYDCNCTKNSDGVESCSTCSEDRYTVEWTCKTSIGDFQIEKLDSTWRSVYSKPNPARYDAIIVGEPASRTNVYKNYIQAVPDTLFKPVTTEQKARFKDLIPAYPDQVFDIYRINRFVTVGFEFTDRAQWNQGISEMLKPLGSLKQVNVIVVVVKTNDPNYVYALRDAWEGANKNDVVLVLGSEDGQTILWTDVISWTKNELFKVELRDAALALGTIRRDTVLSLLDTQIRKNFERRHMSEFEYLSNEISPPPWLLILLGVILCAGYAGGVLWIASEENKRGGFRRRRF